MRSRSVLALALVAALPLATYAQQQKQAAPPPPRAKAGGVVAKAPGAAAAVAYATVSATVEAVDPATRTVSLRGPRGNVVDVVAGEEVRNFDQIRKGDRLSVKYAESLTLALRKASKGVGRAETEAVSRAEPGQKPGGVARRDVTVVADVTQVDAAAKKISVRGPRGNTVELDVRDPEQLKHIKKGDKVEATYTQAIAVSMEASGAAPAKPAEKKK